VDIRELLDEVKDAAFEVRKNLSFGYLESVYQRALLYELQDRGIKAVIEAPIEARYKGRTVGEFRADILVEDKIIIELKACQNLLPAHEAQLVNYLQTTGIDKGLLINYGGEIFACREKDRIYKTREPKGS